MLELKFIRKNPDLVRADLRKRGDNAKLDLLEELLKSDERWRALQAELEGFRALRNKVSQQINDAKKAGGDATQLLRQAAELPGRIKTAEAEVEGLVSRIHFIQLRLPNLLHESVPVGRDDSENQVVRTVGNAAQPKHAIKSHVDWITENDEADLERAAKISGARFFILKNDLVLLDLALQRFALDHLYDKRFTLIAPPHMMRRQYYEGVTDLADFETVMYPVKGDETENGDENDLYLIATSEHPLVAMHADEVFAEKDLPLKYAGISPCYRKEAGAHGKDTKGIFRVHQFNKVEQVVFAKPEDSWRLHEELLRNTEELFQALEIPYRVVNVCTGDIGTVAAKKYDIEGWFPAQGKFRELASCSNCTAYQATRLSIKFERANDEREFVHTLNNTAIATARAIVAILENHQRTDGRVDVPMALRPYMNGAEVIGKKP